MPYKPTDLTATLSFDPEIWAVLEKMAIARGHKNTRAFINSEVRRLGKFHEAHPQCKGKNIKKSNHYRIPKFLERTFLNLSCRYNMKIPSLLTCYLIVQALEFANITPEASEHQY